MQFDARARRYISVVLLTGGSVALWSVLQWTPTPLGPFLLYLLVSVAAAIYKVRLPGVTGTMSVFFIFQFLGILQLGLAQTVVMGLVASVVQCYWYAKQRPAPVQVLFNLAITSLATVGAYEVYTSTLLISLGLERLARLMTAAVVYFLLNTGPVSGAIATTEHKDVLQVWKDCYFWCFPYYLVGASLAASFDWATRVWGLEASLLAVPVVFLVYRSYRLYLDRLESETNHVREVASLHLRTIEALALAIDAKDQTTHDHLQRVQTYALAIGEEMGLSAQELQALQAASMLHDIGKLAVPEHIISKPGRLTPEEFEKMKIHPTVGAEILERVEFPYPVAPVVRAHHEKWDGSGYPNGLRGEEIPVAARILSVVDCMDAMASDRQYRRAMPMEEVLAYIQSESGRSFDPRVVEILMQKHADLEIKSHSAVQGDELPKLSTDARIERGLAPDAGFEGQAAPPAGDGATHFLTSIAAARQEVQTLFELAQDLGQSLSLPETLGVVASRLKRIVPFDCLAIYLVKGERLVPEYVTGEDAPLFLSLEIPMGQGLSGWVAENRRTILNGNPSVEPGYLNDPTKFSKLSSALAVPLEGANGVTGVLALYKSQRDGFTRDELRVLMGVSAKLSVSIENLRRFEEAETSATTDYLTGLPNARSLFFHLDAEVARCQREGTTLSLLVCDLNGFKQVNDQLGHMAGNRLLSLVAQKWRSRCRVYDYLARMGGDEFVMVLPNLPAAKLAERVLEFEKAAEEAGKEIGGGMLSVSIGAARFPEEGTDSEELLAEADRRMYRRKQELRALSQTANGTGKATQAEIFTPEPAQSPGKI